MSKTIAEKLLRKAQTAQTRFWDAVRELELELGVDIDCAFDLEGMTVEGLIEGAEEEVQA